MTGLQAGSGPRRVQGLGPGPLGVHPAPLPSTPISETSCCWGWGRGTCRRTESPGDPGRGSRGQRRETSEGWRGPRPAPAALRPACGRLRALSGSPGGGGVGQFWKILAALGSMMVGEEENRAGCPGLGDGGALGTAGVSGGARSSCCSAPRPPRRTCLGTGLGTGKRKGCECGDRKGSPAAAPGEATPRRNAQRALWEAPRRPGRRSSGEARETKVSEPPPSPPSAPRPRAGERDPCPDPAPRPARAITKETRPPALPSPRRLKTDPSAGTGR